MNTIFGLKLMLWECLIFFYYFTTNLIYSLCFHFVADHEWQMYLGKTFELLFANTKIITLRREQLRSEKGTNNHNIGFRNPFGKRCANNKNLYGVKYNVCFFNKNFILLYNMKHNQN